MLIRRTRTGWEAQLPQAMARVAGAAWWPLPLPPSTSELSAIELAARTTFAKADGGRIEVLRAERRLNHA